MKRVKIADQTSNVQFLALDPTNSMTPIDCKHYIGGAKQIVGECAGASPLLDGLFIEAYKKGKERYKSM